MTTVVEREGEDDVIFNREGSAIAELNCPSTNPMTIVPVPRISQNTIVYCDTHSPDGLGSLEPAIGLPADAQIGDSVEVYVKTKSQDGSLPNTGVLVWPPEGEFIPFQERSSVGFPAGVKFTKISATRWVMR